MRLLAAALMMLLAACAATPVAPKTDLAQASAECPTASPEKLVKLMAEKGITEMEKLEGDKARAFIAMLNHQSLVKLDRVDLILVFHDDKIFLAAHFAKGCAIAHTVGPWDAIKKLFGQKV